MPLPKHWASPEDFATLFQYFWHRDFPTDEKASGAHRTDWTIHIGVIVRSIGDLMGLAARFESGGRKDALLRSADGDEIAIEWEWEGVWGNELKKLYNHKARPLTKTQPARILKYAVLITYTHTPNVEKVYQHVLENWKDALYPLLLILIDLEETKKYSFGKEFKTLQMSLFDNNKYFELRSAPAFPWNVESSRWYFLRT